MATAARQGSRTLSVATRARPLGPQARRVCQSVLLPMPDKENDSFVLEQKVFRHSFTQISNLICSNTCELDLQSKELHHIFPSLCSATNQTCPPLKATDMATAGLLRNVTETAAYHVPHNSIAHVITSTHTRHCHVTRNISVEILVFCENTAFATCSKSVISAAKRQLPGVQCLLALML